jgi:hypothetical protein
MQQMMSENYGDEGSSRGGGPVGAFYQQQQQQQVDAMNYLPPQRYGSVAPAGGTVQAHFRHEGRPLSLPQSQHPYHLPQMQYQQQQQQQVMPQLQFSSPAFSQALAQQRGMAAQLPQQPSSSSAVAALASGRRPSPRLVDSSQWNAAQRFAAAQMQAQQQPVDAPRVYKGGFALK